jgi:hypothetical protein
MRTLENRSSLVLKDTRRCRVTGGEEVSNATGSL